MIAWIVALRAEAQPLVRGLSLRAFSRATPWPLYLAADGGAALVVSGVGKAASAAAVGWAQGVLDVAASERSSRGDASGAVSPDAEAAGRTLVAWVNVGIAGHSKGPLGRVLLAHRVVDVATQRAWYPPPVPGVTLESDTVFTVDRPESAFEGAGAYDMEAAGFLTAASRCGSAELAQVVKVVSDTPERPAAELGRREVSSLVEARFDEIVALGEALAARLSAPSRKARANCDNVDASTLDSQ